MIDQAGQSPREQLALAAAIAGIPGKPLLERIEQAAADPNGAELLTLLVLEWADRDPIAAYGWASARPIPLDDLAATHRYQLIQEVFVSCATKDPEGFGKAHKHPLSEFAYIDGVAVLAQNDPLTLGRLQQANGEKWTWHFEYDATLWQGNIRIALADPATLKRVAEGIPPDARSDAPGYETWNYIFKQVDERYRTTDPAAHAKWIKRFPEPASQSSR